MCRYAMYGPYKEKWVCFKCRKCFKQTSRSELTRPMPLAEDGDRLVVCPQCKSRMHDMGLDFHVPAQNDIDQWKKVDVLFRHGYAYRSCGCGGPGLRPARLKDVPGFLLDQREKAAEWKREQEVQRRAEELEKERQRRWQKRQARQHGF